LPSQVCDTQVIVVRTEGLDDLRCGGVAMVPLGSEKTTDVTLDPAFSDGTTLSIGTTPLHVKEAEPLPASD
jgi:hypothetical protein